MTTRRNASLWLTVPLLLLASCGPLEAWGTSHSTATWNYGLSGDQEALLPGMTSGMISKVALEMGDNVFHLMIWSSALHNCSSGTSSAEGAYVMGMVQSTSGSPDPIALSCADGVHLNGTIGDQELDFEGSAFLLIHTDAEGLVIQEVEVPTGSIQALDIGEQVNREAFAERFKVDVFFRNPRNK